MLDFYNYLFYQFFLPSYFLTYLDSEKRNAGALIPEGEVHALLGDRYGFDLRVDVHFGVGIESALPRRYSTWGNRGMNGDVKVKY